MALKKQIKITITSCEPYTIKGRDGQTYKGFLVEGFDHGNQPTRFTSAEGKYKPVDADRYQEAQSISVSLYGRTTLDGKVKWADFEREKKSLDKDFSESNPF